MGLSEFFWNLGAWNWFIVAVALFALESVVPGVHFVWFGIAAVIVGGARPHRRHGMGVAADHLRHHLLHHRLLRAPLRCA